jgi:UDP-glucose 4-epimerase
MAEPSRKARRVLVTGGAGFVGSHLLRLLQAQGDELTVLDNLSVGRRESLPAGVVLREADVCDAEAVEAAMQGQDVCIHLAARVAIRSSFDFVVEDTKVNVLGTACVMRAVARTPSVHSVVAASSMAVYADASDPTPIAESHPTEPMSPYGVSKLALERLVHGMCQNTGRRSVVLRLFNTYGPGQALSPYVGAATIFANALRTGRAPTIFGDGEQCRDFVHVQDVARAFQLAAASDVSGLTLNIGTGQATSVNRLYALIRSTLGSELQAVHAPAAAGELRYSVASIEAARRTLGFTPNVALHLGLAQTFAAP